MANYQEKLIIEVSNPDTHAECIDEQAFKWSHGRAIFASERPYNDVQLSNGKMVRTDQCNSSYIVLQGIEIGVIPSCASRVTSEMFLETTSTIADMASPSQLNEGILFPSVSQLREVSTKVATRVCTVAYEQYVIYARIKEGELLEDAVSSTMFTPEYVPLVYHSCR